MHYVVTLTLSIEAKTEAEAIQKLREKALQADYDSFEVEIDPTLQ